MVVDDTTRQSWTANDRHSTCPDRTVSMETYEAGCFNCSTTTATVETEPITEQHPHFIADKVGKPVECSTPTKLPRN